MERPRHIPEAVRRQVEFFAGQACASCGAAIDGERLKRHLDHRLAFARGGEHVVFNLQPLCHRCNLAKSDVLTPRAQYIETLKQQRAEELCTYFQETPAHIIGNERLREPQEQGYLALRDYFVEDPPMPAIVVLPTGCGKSGLIAVTPFGIAEGRVLVVAPNLTIKEGLAGKTLAGPASFYRTCDVLGPETPLPRVVVLERGQANEEDCLRADLIVTNVQQAQGWLPLFTSDFFDMIIVDEAHHVPADSWQNINAAFPNAKKVYLTATPFRGDDQPIVAEPVYDYRLSDAIQAGYVKNVTRVDAVASEMTFTLEGETRRCRLEEIMELRDEAWFARGVALSEVCNLTIIDRSAAILQAKRRSGIPHQIIAAACSIRHAEQVADLYASRGLQATWVASEGMTLEERERRIADFDAGRYGVMVNVGILGEGYDNPHISIAALFRPFRSVAPYAQFVGRAVRIIPGGGPEDNIAHVVTHVGLGQAPLWEYFKAETAEAAILSAFDCWAGEEEKPGKAFAIHKGERRGRQRAAVMQEVIDHYDVDTFVTPKGVDAEAVQEHLAHLETLMDGLQRLGLDVPDAEQLRHMIAEMNQPLGGGPLAAPPNRPDLERRAYRRGLDRAVRHAAGAVIRELGIAAGDDLIAIVGNGDERSNYEVMIRAINRALNMAMGKEVSASNRNAWLQEELKAAKRMLPHVQEGVTQRLRVAASYGDSKNDSSNKPGVPYGDFDWGTPF